MKDPSPEKSVGILLHEEEHLIRLFASKYVGDSGLMTSLAKRADRAIHILGGRSDGLTTVPTWEQNHSSIFDEGARHAEVESLQRGRGDSLP
jgi:hypothetical protein